MNREKNTHNTPRDSRGRWLPGHSANPAGRPKQSGSRRFLQDLRRAAEEIALPQIVELARAGDSDSCKLLLTLAAPKAKPIAEPVPVAVSDGAPLVEKLQAIEQAALQGELTPEDAERLTAICQKANTSRMMCELSQKVGVLISPGMMDEEKWERAARGHNFNLDEE